MTERLIVVGVDESAESLAALEWAAAEAQPGADQLHIVHAYDLLSFSGSCWGPAVRANDARRSAARCLVATAVQAARTRRPGLDVDGSEIVGAPAVVLSDMSRVVDLVAIGGVSARRSPERGAGRRIGRRVATRAACAVVVVPDGGPATTGAQDLPVALLLDGPGLPRDAIEFAFGMASRRHVPLVVTQTWALGLPGEPEDRADVAWWETSRQKDLDVEFSTWQQRHPDVGVSVELRQESAFTAARQLHHTAQLVVVARDTAGGPGLGRVPKTALGRPLCPVAVIPDGGGRRVSGAQEQKWDATGAATAAAPG